MPRAVEEQDSDEEITLAAFTTKSKKKPGDKKHKSPAPAESGSSKQASAQPPPPQPQLIVPFVGKAQLEDVELCTDEDASIQRHMDDTEKLLSAFENVLHSHETIIAKAAAKVEERCAVHKREAVEAATLAAIHTTELRMASELRSSVADALAEAREAAMAAQEKAVAEAVRQTEARCFEQQRLAVAQVTEMHQRSIGQPEEEIAASAAAFNFQEAASAAAAALAASSSLLAREAETLVDQDKPPEETAMDVTDAAAEGEDVQPKDEADEQESAAEPATAAGALQFF